MLIAMSVYDTYENGRTQYTKATLDSLIETVDFNQHRLFIIDNGSCKPTIGLYGEYAKRMPFTLIRNHKNIGTAAAINKAWRHREHGEHAVKMDNDIVIHYRGWAELMGQVFLKDDSIGICGLKRKDLEERPDHPRERFNSTLRMLPHVPGERWTVIEEVEHVMGTCQGYSTVLLDKMGYLYQMQDEGNLYGFDDSLASYRTKLLDMKRVFLPWIEIDHIDPGDTPFQDWKHTNALKWMHAFNRVKEEYKSGKRPIYYDGP